MIRHEIADEHEQSESVVNDSRDEDETVLKLFIRYVRIRTTHAAITITYLSLTSAILFYI